MLLFTNKSTLKIELTLNSQHIQWFSMTDCKAKLFTILSLKESTSAEA